MRRRPESLFRTLLSHLRGERNPCTGRKGKVVRSRPIQGFSGGRERELGVLDMVFGVAVRTAGTTGLGAGPKGIFDDGLQGARAASTLGAAAEAAIHLLRAARKVQSSVHGIANIMVAEDVAGTDDHEVGGPLGYAC